METATYQGSLPHLARSLQASVRSQPDAATMQIQCVLKQNTLMVLGQHPATNQPDAQQVFTTLAQVLQTDVLNEFSAELPPDAVVPNQAKLYLRVAGQRQPYAFHIVELVAVPSPIAPDVDRTADLEPTVAVTDPPMDLSSEPMADQAVAEDESPTAVFDLVPTLPLEEPTVVPPLSTRSRLWPWLLAGVGVSVVCFATGLWAMSRPCTVGRCDSLQTAQTLSQQSAQSLQTAHAETDLRPIRQQLTEAQRLLSQIPIWSRSHDAATALQQTDQGLAQNLDPLIAADDKAATATQKTQTLPQSIADWQTTVSLWQGAIDQLRAVPPANPLYALAQQRLMRYQERLDATDKMMAAEQQAQKTLAAAQDTAKVAAARQSIAQTPENWQLAQTTWQVVVNALQEIPQTTTSYAAAQPLLADYRSKLAAARDRSTQEKISQTAFTQAMNLAQKAQVAQRQQQWSQAVASWRDALTYAKQVPNGSTFYEQAQPLVASYSNALKQAEAQLQVATATQRTRADLNRVCAGSPRICSFAIASDVIRVQFTPAYERALRTAFVVGQSGDYSTLGGAVNHVDTLQTALQTIANNAGVPLEVYSADGSELIGSFNPGG